MTNLPKLSLPYHSEDLHTALQDAASAASALLALVKLGADDAVLPYWRHVTSLVPEYSVEKDRIEADWLRSQIAAIKQTLSEADELLAKKSCKLTWSFLLTTADMVRELKKGEPS